MYLSTILIYLQLFIYGFSDVERLRKKLGGIIEEEEQHYQTEKAKALKRALKVEKEEYLRSTVKNVLEVAKDEAVNADYSDYHERRRLQLEEFQVCAQCIVV